MSVPDTRKSYYENAGNIIDLYSELVEQTSKTLFSWKLNIIEAPNLKGMSKRQAFMAEILAPYPLPNNLFSTSYFIRLFIFLIWLASSMAYLKPASQPATSNNTPSIWISILVLIFFIISAIFIYGYTE